MASSSVSEAVIAALTVDAVHQVIDRVLVVGQASSTASVSAPASSSHPWRRIVDWTAVTTTTTMESSFSNGASLTHPNTTETPTPTTTAPFFFGIYRQAPSQSLLQTDAIDETVAVCTFYLAYSTWDGRMFNVDRLMVGSSSKNDDIEALYRILAQMAVALNCTRLTWKVRPMEDTQPLNRSSFG
jgi:hypothetical protein